MNRKIGHSIEKRQAALSVTGFVGLALAGGATLIEPGAGETGVGGNPFTALGLYLLMGFCLFMTSWAVARGFRLDPNTDRPFLEPLEQGLKIAMEVFAILTLLSIWFEL